jgi:hypothetical protein
MVSRGGEGGQRVGQGVCREGAGGWAGGGAREWGRGAKRPAPALTPSLGGNPTQSIKKHENVKPWNWHCLIG